MKVVTKGIALVLAVICTMAAIPFSALAEESAAQGAEVTQVTSGESAIMDAGGYGKYKESTAYSAAEAEITALSDCFDAALSSGAAASADAEYSTVYRLDNGGSASFKVTAPKDAVYNIALIFSNVNETTEKYEFGFKIDGEYPFEGCKKLSVSAIWVDDGGIRELTSGDQVNPVQKHADGFFDGMLTDESGIELYPYEFALSAGTHIITVSATGNPFLLAGLKLTPPEEIRTYAQVSAEYAGLPVYAGDQIEIEAESPLYKNAYSLSAKSDNGSASISPSSAERSLINYIGGDTWKQPGEEITWKLDVPQDGLYKLGFSFKQSTVNRGQVYRWLKIDGKTPFAEATDIGFSYSTKWQFNSFADENGNDYLIYLTQGEHTLSLAITLADIAEVFDRLAAIVEPLGNTYLDIVMITGDSPDTNRDYELHKQIPDFIDTLTQVRENLTALSAEIGVTLKVNGELNGALKNMARIIDNMLNNLYSAHLYIPTYYTAYQTLSAWLYDIKKMTLSLDQIILAAPDADYETPMAGWGERLIFSVRRFLNSYVRKTGVVESSSDKTLPTIKIWVNWGRDQVKVLNTLIQDSFTPQNDVNVKVEQVNASLVQGVVSGNSPDLYLHMARTEPVNLAMRGVLYNLKNFDDYEEVLGNFQDGAETPYIYRDGCYALPDMQSFYVMFCRTDILSELGIEVPKTWDEFLTATGILQRNNMNSYLPYVKIAAATTVNTGAGGLSIFPTMLLQNGGSVYNSEKNATALNSQESVKAFTFWTDFYSQYSLDQDANFYQKFRVGTIPLGIASYTQYLTFRVTAPEIDGKWKIAPIPGVINENGQLNNSCSGSGTGCSIMKSSKEKEAAWKFLKWWVSADTQYRYSAENEAILGETGRVTTSNIEALSRLSWDHESFEVISTQWKNVTEIPEVPGSYFVARSIDQAFWAAKNKKSSPKEAIVDWSEICDKEVARKINEYADKDIGE